MKNISIFLAILALFFADAALAHAVVTTLTGNAQAQRGTATARVLRLGDEVVQGDTVSTGANSSLVLRFDDGQLAALTSNSRMTVSEYQYNAQSGSGNVLLSLIAGGMRAVTGLIGRNTPERVGYRAATATIGIRGTDVTIATDGGNVVAVVNAGVITFTFGGKTITLTEGQSAFGRAGAAAELVSRATAEILRELPGDLLNSVQAAELLRDALTTAIRTGQSSTLDLRTPTPGGGSGTSSNPASGS